MDDTAAGGATYSIRAVDRVCDILDALRRSGKPVSLGALTDQVALPKSSVLRYLSALETRQYVERDALDSAFRLGSAFRAPDQEYLAALREAALPHLIALRNRFGETVNLGVLQGDEVLHVEVAESERAVRLAARRGDRSPMHSTAIGKIIAAELMPEVVDGILARAGMTAVTPRTITDAGAFHAELVRARQRGFGIDDCENQSDGRCVAVLLHGLALPAAVSVSAPASRFPGDDAVRVADELRAHLGGLARSVGAVPR